MNERLYQLMRQAQRVAYANASAKKKTNSPQNNTVWNEFPEVFAELIVRECVNRIEQNRSSGENTDSWTITRDMAFHQMKEDLKKHFGVEE